MKYKIVTHPHDHKKEKDWAIVLDFISENIEVSSLRKTLELGAGMGNISSYFVSQGVSAFAEDINFEYLDKIKKRNQLISTLQHDINTPLPFPDNSFDFVSCVGTLHYGYIKNLQLIWNEMIRVSNKYILVDFFSKYSIYRFLEKIYNPLYNPRTYSKKEVFNLIKKFNLDIVSKTSTKSLPIIRQAFPFTGKAVYLILEKLK